MGGSSDICLTPQCVTAAAEILHNLHPSYDEIDPCERFDEYVCGGYPSRFPTEKDPGVLTRMARANIQVTQTILEEEPPKFENDDDEEIFDLLLTNYKSCMDESAINATGFGPISEIVSKLAELFPLGKGGYTSNDTMTDEDLDNFAAATAYLTSIGVPVVGDFYTFPDLENPETVVPAYGLAAAYRIDMTLPPTSPARYAEYLETNETIPESIRELLPTEEGKDAVPQLTEGILALIESMMVIEAPSLLMNSSELLQSTWQTTTVKEAAKSAPALVIDKVIDLLTPEDYKPDRMVLSNKSIYKDVSDVIANTPKAVLQAFMILRIVENYAPYILALPTENRATTTCFTYIDESLPWILSKFFMDKKYSDAQHEAAVAVTEAVRDVFVKRVENSTWLSEETRKLVVEKAQDTQLNVGYPEEEPNARNATALKSFYDGLNLTNSFISNALSLRQWAAHKSWNETLLEPVNRLKWKEYGVHSYNANARASRENNMIMMPATMTLFPAFEPELPLYIQYARFAYVAAHEIVHNFDDVGILISNDRKFEDWLSEDSVAAYTERAECISEQYSRVPVSLPDGTVLKNPETNKTLTVNGTLTLSENIADQGGLSIAYEAWKKTVDECKDNSTQPALPGLENFTLEQVFFIAFGQSWCSSPSEQTMRDDVAAGGHSPGFARTRITPRNVEGFKEAWQCKKPAPECKIW